MCQSLKENVKIRTHFISKSRYVKLISLDEYSYNYDLPNRQIITIRSRWKEHFALKVDHGMTSILFIILFQTYNDFNKIPFS